MQNQIPLKELKHSPDNVRKVKASDTSLVNLCASIKSKGLLHNLVVVKNGKGFNVIDGNRRLDALNKIYKDKATPINCIVLEHDDKEVGLHANMMREDMHPLDESDVIQALVADGSEDYSSVASRFGQTETWVKQRISLSELSDLAKEKFRNYEFNLGVAKALTLGTHEKQDNYLEHYDEYYSDQAKRHMLSSKIHIHCALFDINASNSEELAIESDLFSEDQYITNFNAFERLQLSEIEKQKQGFYDEGYHMVYVLMDSYIFEHPETKTLQRVHDEESRNISDMIMVITYDTSRFLINYNKMIVQESQEVQEALEEANKGEDEVELTPVVMSKPQKDILNGYYAENVKHSLMDEKHLKLMMSLLCHRKLGYGAYENTNRVGSIYADNQNNFPSGDEPDDNPTPIYQQIIIKHRDNAIEAFNNDGTPPLHYCLNLDTQALNRLFIACCITGISRFDLQDENLKKAIGDSANPTLWFKPDSRWLNKYKIKQIGQLEEYLFGAVSEIKTKSKRLDNIVAHLKEHPTFDPYGSWPQ